MISTTSDPDVTHTFVHHYIRCPALWSVISSVMQTCNPPLPEQRLCLTVLADPRGIVLAHGIYHAIYYEGGGVGARES